MLITSKQTSAAHKVLSTANCGLKRRKIHHNTKQAVRIFRTACFYNYSDQNYASGVSSTAGASGATSATLAFFSFFAAFSAAKSILSFKSDKD